MIYPIPLLVKQKTEIYLFFSIFYLICSVNQTCQDGIFFCFLFIIFIDFNIILLGFAGPSILLREMEKMKMPTRVCMEMPVNHQMMKNEPAPAP